MNETIREVWYRYEVVRAVTSLESAVENGKRLGRKALYFGCWDRIGHYWHDTRGSHLWSNTPADMPGVWLKLADGGLLKNGKIVDKNTGRVHWTCAGAEAFWYAFYWWDNSVDRRGGSNSGFYVRGFGWPEAQEAFDYACVEFPCVVGRQINPLVLQNPAKGNQSLRV